MARKDLLNMQDLSGIELTADMHSKMCSQLNPNVNHDQPVKRWFYVGFLHRLMVV